MIEMPKIKIDPTLLNCVADALGRVPETLYDFQKVKTLSCGGKPLYRKLVDPTHDPLPERLEIEEGNFSIIGKMARLKKLTISAMPVRDFSFLRTCPALETLEISGCGVIDCALLENVTSLKILSLHHCSEVKNAESILKLFRLTRLSLEGSRLENADCFDHCRIREVYLPEYIVKAKQAKKDAEKKAENRSEKRAEKEPENRPEKKSEHKTGKRAGFGGSNAGEVVIEKVPFQAVTREKDQDPYALEDTDSFLWEVYRGAYGNVAAEVEVMMGAREEAPEALKLRRLETVPKTNYEIVFDNLFENLYHQMSFYQATWLVIPYLAKIMSKWEEEEDLEWVFRGIMAAGSTLATDVFGDRPEDNRYGEEDMLWTDRYGDKAEGISEADRYGDKAEDRTWADTYDGKPKEISVYESYQNAIKQIQAITVNFLAEHLAYVLEKGDYRRSEFAVAVSAILGERKLAYMLFLSSLNACYVVCPACDNCDEEMEIGYFDLSERIEPADIPAGKGDSKSPGDAKQWLYNLFALLEDHMGLEYLRYIFGIYTCPECGEKIPVLAGMEAYYLEE